MNGAYIIIQSQTAASLEEKVNHFISLGYVPLGSVTCITVKDEPVGGPGVPGSYGPNPYNAYGGDTKKFYQSMINMDLIHTDNTEPDPEVEEEAWT